MSRVWPTPSEELLLRATLLPDERAVDAWRAIRPTLHVPTMPGSTTVLLPALRRNLLARGVDDELLELFKGVHRHSWARTQLLLAPLLPIVAALEERGIATMLLKGGAFVADTRLDAGMRAMNDLDVLVPTDRRGEAIEVLVEHGLRPVDGAAPWYVADHVPAYSPSYGFRDALDRQLDLHWHVLHASRQPDADDDFWAAATAIELLGVRTRALVPADELLLVVTHGLRWSPSPGLRWVVDAALLASGAFGPVDYDRLVAQCRRRRIAAPLLAGLAYLRDVADVDVPAEALRGLRQIRTPGERAWLRAGSVPPRRRSRAAHRFILHEQHLRGRLPLGARATAWRRLVLERERVRLGPGSEGAAAIRREPDARAHPPHATLDFRDPEVVRGHVARGTWRAERDGCWTAGRRTRLVVALPEPSATLLAVELAAAPFTGPGLPAQRLRMSAGADLLSAIRTDAPTTLVGVLPRGLRSVDLRLEAPDAASPRELGIGDDDRELGFRLQTLALRAPPAVSAGTPFALDDEALLAGGWSTLDPAGRWTVGGSSRLLLQLREGPAEVDLVLRGRPFVGRSGPLRFDVAAGGRLAGTIGYETNAAGQSRRVRLGPEDFGPAGDVLVELRCHDPRSPSAEGVGDDPRLLGLCLSELALEQRRAD